MMSDTCVIDDRPPSAVTESLAVEVRDLRMSYGSTEVLRGVDFDVRYGEVFCLLGPNGAGKTTTLEILEGFRPPSNRHAERSGCHGPFGINGSVRRVSAARGGGAAGLRFSHGGFRAGPRGGPQ